MPLIPLVSSSAPAVRASGAVPESLRALVDGPLHSGRVVHAGPDAVYLDLGGTCAGVVSARASRVPCALRTLLPRLPHVPVGATGTVGGGGVALPGLVVDAGPAASYAVPPLRGEALDLARTRLLTLAGDALALAALRHAGSLLPRTATDLLADSDPAAAATLLGLGPGLTPLGDDVLAGWLAAAVATAHPSLDAVRTKVLTLAPLRTTTLSATLLACAARGEAVPEFTAVLHGDAPLGPLLSLGATSGAGLALGALLAFDLLPTATEGTAA